MKMRCIILYAGPYSLVTDDGAILEGISCYYVLVSDLVPSSYGSGSVGTQPFKQSLPISFKSKLFKVPAIYDIDFKMGVVKGKPVLTPVNITYIGDFDIVEKSKK